ncbi:MAG TPA: enoyl-CoA hydratase [Acidimicrobiales bacterium]
MNWPTDETFEQIRYELPDPHVARVVLARPETRNAQNHEMLYEIDRAFQKAMRDPEIEVVILAADGPHFSSGHDLKEQPGLAEDITPVVQAAGHHEPGVFGMYAGEQEYYVGLHWRWRNLAKPTIAQVQGKAMAGGLMLVWPMDLIVASDDAQFSDPVVAFGVNGHEYFVHAWELGQRKAKEMLFTGATFSAGECHRLGMINHVVPRAELETFTLELARRIATRPSLGLKLAKQAVNFSLDVQGQYQAITGALAMHHVGHAHARCEHGLPVDPTGFKVIRNDARQGSEAS